MRKCKHSLKPQGNSPWHSLYEESLWSKNIVWTLSLGLSLQATEPRFPSRPEHNPGSMVTGPSLLWIFWNAMCQGHLRFFTVCDMIKFHTILCGYYSSALTETGRRWSPTWPIRSCLLLNYVKSHFAKNLRGVAYLALQHYAHWISISHRKKYKYCWWANWWRQSSSSTA
jgi:hypothetical protein